MPSKRSKKTHEDHLTCVCFFCHKKAPDRRLTTSQKEYISQEVYKDYGKYQSTFPSGVCGNCCRVANDQIKSIKNKDHKASKTFPVKLDYDDVLKKLQKIPISTRSRLNCDCFICEISKAGCIVDVKKPQKIEKKCPNCFAILKSGTHKICNRPQRVDNLMKDLTPKTRLQLALRTLKEEKEKKNSSSPIKVSSSLGGHATAISVGPIPSSSSKNE